MIYPLANTKGSYQFLYSEVNTNHHELIKRFSPRSLFSKVQQYVKVCILLVQDNFICLTTFKTPSDKVNILTIPYVSQIVRLLRYIPYISEVYTVFLRLQPSLIRTLELQPSVQKPPHLQFCLQPIPLIQYGFLNIPLDKRRAWFS